MKTITDLLPLAVGVALVGAVTWYLLDRDIGPGKWLLAGLLFAHGWVHVMFVFPRPAASTASGPEWPFDMGRSWLISGVGLDAGLVRTLGIVVMIAVFAGFLLTALSTVGILVPAGWWSGLLIGSAAASTLLLAMFASPAFLLGFAINAALVWLVTASIWSPDRLLT